MTTSRSLVVVVDDDESVRESLPHLIRQFGLAARTFTSAEEFLASGLLHETRCLILDVAMPGMSGLELQEELLRRDHAIPIVFITAHEDETVRPRVLERAPWNACSSPLVGRHFARHSIWLFDWPDDMESPRKSSERTTESAIRPSAPIVFVVDDDVSVQESLASLIRWAGWKPETFSSAMDFLARAPNDVPSCLVLDVDLPDLNGLDLQERVTADRTDLPIIFITGYGDIPMSVRAMKAGAAEFLTKPFERDAMLKAIENALDRSRTALEKASQLRTLRERYATLTRREREVFAGVASGLLNKQVGAELGMTEATVKAHRGQVMQKMKADSLADLVRFAAKLNLELPARPSHLSTSDASS